MRDGKHWVALMAARTGITCVLLAGATGCLPPAAAVPPPAPRALNYSYTPPFTAPAGSARVVLAVVQPQWARADEQNLFSFTTQMKSDFISLVTARGYLTRGPFMSYADMVYPDKTGSDLVLIPNIGLMATFSDPALRQAGGFLEALREPGNAGPFVTTGTVTIRGRVDLTLSESMTNERMWTKSITIEPIVLTFAGTKLYHVASGPLTRLNFGSFVADDPGFQAAVYPKLEEMYLTIMQKSWDYLDPRELADVKAQAAQLKKKP